MLAGQRPGVDALSDHFGVKWKALIPVNGEAMISHVVRSLKRCTAIGRIIVLAQNTEAVESAVYAGGEAEVMQSDDGISLSIKKALESVMFSQPVLVTTADHPLLTKAMIEEFIQKAEGDLAIGMVEKQTMLARFPDAKRTWLRFSDGSWSGANLFALRSPKTIRALELWAAAEQDRKKIWRLFMHFGSYLAFRALTRTIGLEDALRKAGRRLGLDARLVRMSDPIAAVDVDKVSDHALAEAILSDRNRVSG